VPSEPSIQIVRDIAAQLRTALSNMPPTIPSFSSFPNGCCGNTAELLIKFMHDAGCTGMQYASAWSGEDFLPALDSSHAWVEYRGYIIDITLNQFSDRISEPIEPIFFSKDRRLHDKYFDRQVEIYDVSRSLRCADRYSQNGFYGNFRDIYDAASARMTLNM